jgi:carbon starvation protein
LARPDWLPGSILASGAITAGWGLLIHTGSITTIWPMFGIANQLLAAVALAVATTIIINEGKSKYAWVTLVPLAFVSITTLTAGGLSVRDNFWPMAVGHDASQHFQGWVNTIATVTMMACVIVILANACWKWRRVLSGGDPVPLRSTP